MNTLEEVEISCPACGEGISLLIDCCNLGQQYVEDCPVCCAPMVLTVQPEPDGDIRVEASREGD